MLTGVFAAGTKGAMADCLGQFITTKFAADDEEGPYNLHRTAAFALWSAGYCGAMVYCLYSLVLPRIWPITVGS